MAYTLRIQMRRALYRLKRQNGVEIHLYRPTNKTINVRTGVQEITYDVLSIRRAILLPNNITRKFAYDLTF